MIGVFPCKHFGTGVPLMHQHTLQQIRKNSFSFPYFWESDSINIIRTSPAYYYYYVVYY